MKREKGYPFEVILPEGLSIIGAILSEQIKSLGWRDRLVAKIGALTKGTLEDLIQKLGVLIL